MANENVFIACYCDGELTINEKNEALYTGGVVRPLMINISSTFGELEDEIFNISLIDREQFNIRIVCNWPIDSMRSAAVHVTNDRETSVVLELGHRVVSIQLFV